MILGSWIVGLGFIMPVSAAEPSAVPKPPIPLNLQIPIPGFDPENQIIYGPTGGCEANFVCVRTIEAYLNAIYKWGASAGVMFAIVLIMVGGIEWMIGSAVGTIERAKSRIRNASVGLILVLVTTVFLQFINPKITQLSAIQLPVIAQKFLQSENTHLDSTGTGGNATTTQAVPSDIVETATSTAGSGRSPTGATGPAQNMTLYSQKNYSVPYGVCGTIKASGCGPTSVAMISKYYGVNVTPDTVADAFATQGHRACYRQKDDGTVDCDACQGTSWAAYLPQTSPYLQSNHLTSRQLWPTQKRDILESLAQGKPLLASVGCSRFTANGHFIVLAGMDRDGTIFVKDPNSVSLNKTNVEELWATEPYKDSRRDCTGKHRLGLTVLRAAWLIEPET